MTPARRLLVAILFAAIVLAGCNLGVPTPPFEAEWCYTYNFLTDDYDAVLTSGAWAEDVGFYDDETGQLDLTITHSAVVKPVQVILTGRRIASGQINVVGSGTIFGITASINETLPDGIDTAQLAFVPASSTDSGTTIHITTSPSNTVAIESILILGNGVNPFPFNSCGDATPTPTPSDTPVPSSTFTPTYTPTQTNTPSPTPTGVAGYCVLTENFDSIHIPDGVPAGIINSYTTGTGQTGSGLTTSGFSHESTLSVARLRYTVDYTWTLRYTELYFQPHYSNFSNGGETLTFEYRVHGSGTWTNWAGGSDNHLERWQYARVRISWNLARAPTTPGTVATLTNVDEVRWTVQIANDFSGGTPAVTFDDIKVFYSDDSSFCTSRTPTPTQTQTASPTNTGTVTAFPSALPGTATRTPFSVASPTTSLTPSGTLPSPTASCCTPGPSPTLYPFPTAIATINPGDPGDEDNGEIGIINAIGNFFSWAVNSIGNFFAWLGSLIGWFGGFLSNLFTLIGNILQAIIALIQFILGVINEIIAIIGLVILIVQHVLFLFQMWLDQFITLVRAILAAYISAFPIPITGLPNCVTLPTQSNVCAIYYLLSNTIFSGSLGSALMLVILVLIDLSSVFYFIKTVRNLIKKAEGVTRT